ncbi:MAG: hypothetical protein JSW23_06745 [Planctomycetota bacterium]|nr:MAG: hypothetical protein JSW23_06745 [Planctomycetota bacterium]
MERAKKSIILIVVMYCLAFVHSAKGQSEAGETKAEAELRQVALFKNGLGFFVYEVTCPKKSDSFSFVPCAAASHGSFWVSYPPKVELEGLTAREVDMEEMVEAVTVGELLRANVGRKVSVVFDDEQIIGVIKHFADERKGPKPESYGPGGAEMARVNYTGASLGQSRLVIIETDKGEVCIDPHSVKKVEFPGGKAEKRFARKKKSMQVGVKLGGPAGGKKLTVSYLAKGITWAPSYIVDITEGDEARISAKAAVINEVCDLDDVTVQLITGFPNLQFADIVSPLAKKENLGQFLSALAKGQSEVERRGVMYNVAMQRAGAFEEMGAAAAMPAYGAAEAGKVAEDLFLYPVEDVKLSKGEVGYLPLFTESVPYKHIYKWEIPDYVNEEDRYLYGRREQEREAVEEVWHCLRMENKTKVPWTTAPAEIVKEGLILGQDTLNYTAAEGETTVKITQAVGVKAEQVELEIERKRDAARLYGNHYDLVTVEGKLSVRNFQQKAITLEITKTLSGEVKSSEPEAKIESLARGLRRMNAVRELTWRVELGAGERKELNYLYEVYVRR